MRLFYVGKGRYLTDENFCKEVYLGEFTLRLGSTLRIVVLQSSTLAHCGKVMCLAQTQEVNSDPNQVR